MTVRIRSFSPTKSSVPLWGELGSIACDPRGERVALVRQSANRGAATFVLDVRSGATLVDEARVAELAPDGARVVVTDNAGNVTVRDLGTGASRSLGRGIGRVRVASTALGWSFDRERVTVWDLEAGRARGTFATPALRYPIPGAHAPSFAAPRALPDGRTLLWLDARFHVHVLDLEACETRADVTLGPREVPGAWLVTRDGTRGVAVGAKGTVVTYDVGSRAVIARRDRLFGGLWSPHLGALLDDGRLVVESRFVDVVDPITGKRRTVGARDPNRETIRAIHPVRGALVAVLVDRMSGGAGDGSRELELWDVDRESCVASIAASDVIAPMCVSENGRLFAGRDVEVPGRGGASTTWCAFDVEGNAAQSVVPKPGATPVVRTKRASKTKPRAAPEKKTRSR